MSTFTIENVFPTTVVKGELFQRRENISFIEIVSSNSNFYKC